MKIKCPHCKSTMLVYLNDEPISVLKSGIDCVDCDSKIHFNIIGNAAMVSKKAPVPKKKFVFNKPYYQIKPINRAIYA